VVRKPARAPHDLGENPFSSLRVVTTKTAVVRDPLRRTLTQLRLDLEPEQPRERPHRPNAICALEASARELSRVVSRTGPQDAWLSEMK
jgi:hypothetical protein